MVSSPPTGDGTPPTPGDPHPAGPARDDERVRVDPRLLGAQVAPGLVLRGARDAEYRLVKALGPAAQGGFGSLWAALHDEDDGYVVTVAVKILHADVSMTPDAARREYLRCQDRGPHAVRALDHSEDGAEVPFIVMEYLRGPTLQELVVQQGPLSADQARELLRALTSLLVELYSEHDPKRRSYHGDLAPKNVMRTAERFVVVDFGLGHHDDTYTTHRIKPARYVTPEAGRQLADLPAHPIYSDVHQAAQVVLFALTGEHPTNWSRTDRAVDLPRLAAMIPEGTPADLVGLLRRMLTIDMAERARVAAVRAIAEQVRRAPAPVPVAVVSQAARPRRRSRPLRLAYFIPAFLLVAGGLLLLSAPLGGGDDPVEPDRTSTPSAPPSSPSAGAPPAASDVVQVAATFPGIPRDARAVGSVSAPTFCVCGGPRGQAAPKFKVKVWVDDDAGAPVRLRLNNGGADGLGPYLVYSLKGEVAPYSPPPGTGLRMMTWKHAGRTFVAVPANPSDQHEAVAGQGATWETHWAARTLRPGQTFTDTGRYRSDLVFYAPQPVRGAMLLEGWVWYAPNGTALVRRAVKGAPEPASRPTFGRTASPDAF